MIHAFSTVIKMVKFFKWCRSASYIHALMSNIYQKFTFQLWLKILNIWLNDTMIICCEITVTVFDPVISYNDW